MSEVKSVLTPKLWAALIVISIIFSLLGVLSNPFAPSWVYTLLGSFTGPLAALFILLLIAKAVPSLTRKLTPQNLALLYSAVAMSLVFSYFMIPYAIIHNQLAVRQWQYDWHPANREVTGVFIFGPFVSDPSDPIIISAFEGRAAVPWAAWTSSLAWWMVYTICWLLWFVGWFALLEERWIRIEKLPYPAAETGTLPIQLITKGEQPDPRMKVFILGVIIGALVILPVVGTNLTPMFPDIYGWGKDPYLYFFLGVMDFGLLPAGRLIPAIAFLPVNPMIYVLFYLFSTKILFSIWFFSLFGVLIPSQIAYYMGYYTEIAEKSWRFHDFLNLEPFRWNGIWIGSFIGVIATWFVLNVSYVKGLFKRVTPPDKAISNIAGWLLIVVSTVVLIVQHIIVGVSIVASILIIFSMWLLFLSTTRVYGFASIAGTAWAYPIDWTHFPFLVKHLYIPDPGFRNAEIVTTLNLANRWTGEIIGENNRNFGVAFAVPLCYKIGYDTGTHPKDITKVVLVSGIISALVGYPVALWFTYYYGINNFPMGCADCWWHWVFAQPWGKIDDLGISAGPDRPLWPYILIGIALTAILSVLNFRFVWWPLDPAGVAAALGAAGTGWLLPALVAWIAKTLVLRMGGTKLNDTVAMPFCIGFLVGYWFLMFLGGIGGIIQFFMPK